MPLKLSTMNVDGARRESPSVNASVYGMDKATAKEPSERCAGPGGLCIHMPRELAVRIFAYRSAAPITGARQVFCYSYSMYLEPHSNSPTSRRQSAATQRDEPIVGQ